jgi:hypothetical protein
MPAWIRKLGIGLAVAGAIVAAAEIACRVALGPEPFGDHSPIYFPDEAVGFRIAPNLRFDRFTTNHLGTRGAEPDPAAPERILVLGDSMALGAEVRDGETFCALLEGKLGNGARVYDSGCPGYGPREELAALERLAPELRPTRVVVAFFAGNDFLDAGQDGPTYRVIAGRLVSEKRYQETGPAARAFKNALASAWSLGLVRAVRRISEKPQQTPAEHHDIGPSGMDSGQIRCILELDDYTQAVKRNEPLIAKGWEQMPSHFTKIRDACAKIGAKLTVALLPVPIAFDPGLRERLAKRWNVGPRTIDAERPQRKMLELLGSLGIEALDLAPPLKADGGGGKLHLPGDLHYSTAGHRAVAEALARQFQ